MYSWSVTSASQVIPPRVTLYCVPPLSGAAPCRGAPDDLTGVQFDDGTAFFLREPDSFLNEYELTFFVDVPLGAHAGVEVEVRDLAGRRFLEPGHVAAGEVGAWLLGVNGPQTGNKQDCACRPPHSVTHDEASYHGLSHPPGLNMRSARSACAGFAV